MKKYYYTDGKEKFGPFSKNELLEQKITRNTKVWYYGLNDWTEISKIDSLNELNLSIPPPTINELKIKKNTINIKKGNNKNNIYSSTKWLIGILIGIILFLIVFKKLKKSNEVDYNSVVENSYNSEEDFEMYVDKFYRDINYYGIYPKKPKKTIIKLSRLDQIGNTTHIHGLSFGFDNDDIIEIYINKSSWENFDKPMKYFLMYHELAHDILNVDDLEAKLTNEGKLMYPEISNYENKDMDDFIESYHSLFEEEAKKRK